MEMTHFNPAMENDTMENVTREKDVVVCVCVCFPGGVN